MENLETLTPSALCLFSQVHWRGDHKKIWKSIREYHDKHGGITKGQMKLLNHIYSKYSK